MSDPLSSDNLGVLSSASADMQIKLYQGRITKLAGHIQQFEKELEKCRAQNMVDNFMRTVDIERLRGSLNVLLDHIIELGIKSVDIERQYYWQVDAKHKYEMTTEPTGLVVGDFFDDLDFTEAVLTKNEKDVVAYTLTEAAQVLTYVGEVASAKLASRGG